MRSSPVSPTIVWPGTKTMVPLGKDLRSLIHQPKTAAPNPVAARQVKKKAGETFSEYIELHMMSAIFVFQLGQPGTSQGYLDMVQVPIYCSYTTARASLRSIPARRLSEKNNLTVVMAKSARMRTRGSIAFPPSVASAESGAHRVIVSLGPPHNVIMYT